jgi:tetratricopeptide (TPR) repeat protein
MRNVQEHLNKALRYHKSGSLKQAEQIYREILGKFPANPDAAYFLGTIAVQTGRNDEAVVLFKQVIDSKKRNPQAYTNLAVALQNLGRNEEASAACHKAINLNPGNVTALNTLGNALRGMGKHGEAVEYFEKAIALKQNSAEVHFNLANTLREMDEPERAIKTYVKVIEIKPDFCEAYNYLGNLLKQQNKYEASEACYQKALQINPLYVEAQYNLANVLHDMNKYDKAVEWYFSALDLKPDFAEGYHNLAKSLAALERTGEAIAAYNKAVELKPAFPEAWNALGNIFREQGNVREAMACYRKSVMIKPDFAEVYYNISNVCLDDGNIEEALDSCRQALSLNPDLAEAHWNMALAFLTQGNFEPGWQKYEWRFIKKDSHLPPFVYPVWDGASLKGKTLLIHAEQGVGDEVMFASCLPDVTGLPESCIVECDKRLVPLFSRSFPGIEFIERIHSLDIYPEELPPVDAMIAIGSLPKYYRSGLSRFPKRKGYLVPDEHKTSQWKGRFKEIGDGLKIGISWRGGKDAYVRKMRSTMLDQWTEVFSVPGTHYINLQYGDCADELREMQQDYGVIIHDWEDADPLKDLDNFAAEIAALDLVISVDNSTVHMAGALGVPVWTLLPFSCDWRWMREYEDTPWYSSMRLFRQTDPGKWREVFERISLQLRNMLDTWAVPEIGQSALAGEICPPEKEGFYGAHRPVKHSYGNKEYRCAVVTPVGPGHQDMYKDCLSSINEACKKGKGRFAEIIPVMIDDHEGKSGRSGSRNTGVRMAADGGAEWIFFLDADDVICPGAFEYVSPYLDEYDAVWGSIWTMQKGEQTAKMRKGQLPFLYGIEDIILYDPFVTLQMGHFVRTYAALSEPFNENLDTGEDFDYYLRVWEKYVCIKIPLPLFYNRQGFHSVGERSATGKEWTRQVEKSILQYRQKLIPGTRVLPGTALPAHHA